MDVVCRVSSMAILTGFCCSKKKLDVKWFVFSWSFQHLISSNPCLKNIKTGLSSPSTFLYSNMQIIASGSMLSPERKKNRQSLFTFWQKIEKVCSQFWQKFNIIVFLAVKSQKGWKKGEKSWKFVNIFATLSNFLKFHGFDISTIK